MDAAHARAITAGSGPHVEQAEAALRSMGYALVANARDGASALGMIRALEPKVVITQAVIPGADGVALVRWTRRLRLDLQPAMLVLASPGLRLPGMDALGALGARTLAPPVCVESLRRALDGLECPLPPKAPAQLEALMDALGVPHDPGRECLARAVALVWADRGRLSERQRALYPEVAAQMGLSADQVERAIRHAIDVAWRAGEIERQHRMFGNTIDARRGKPTCGEMIAQLAEKLRWE